MTNDQGPILPCEARAVLRALPPAGRTGTVPDLLREILAAGRDPRVSVEPDDFQSRWRRYRQYPTLAALDAAARGATDQSIRVGVATLPGVWR